MSDIEQLLTQVTDPTVLAQIPVSQLKKLAFEVTKALQHKYIEEQDFTSRKKKKHVHRSRRSDKTNEKSKGTDDRDKEASDEQYEDFDPFTPFGWNPFGFPHRSAYPSGRMHGFFPSHPPPPPPPPAGDFGYPPEFDRRGHKGRHGRWKYDSPEFESRCAPPPPHSRHTGRGPEGFGLPPPPFGSYFDDSFKGEGRHGRHGRHRSDARGYGYGRGRGGEFHGRGHEFGHYAHKSGHHGRGHFGFDRSRDVPPPFEDRFVRYVYDLVDSSDSESTSDSEDATTPESSDLSKCDAKIDGEIVML